MKFRTLTTSAIVFLILFGGLWDSTGYVSSQRPDPESLQSILTEKQENVAVLRDHLALVESRRPNPSDFFDEFENAVLQIAVEIGEEQIMALEKAIELSYEARSWTDVINDDTSSMYIAFAMSDLGQTRINDLEGVINRITEHTLKHKAEE